MASDQYEAEVGGGDVRVHEQQDGSHSHVVITITDPELFDCPICYEPLTIPVYQCAGADPQRSKGGQLTPATSEILH
ncbi:hypothetical protein L3X38_044023 [Prunus dulcis]|uniref:Uncharacterized protein n=1 Tax=Prunus dulcis TaxID=3755 RepID=A0AAD4UZK6_PRUDU|nr:hypothetical protein L3X38_044023 [Prunus dulcis]